MENYKILIKFATRSRPLKFISAIKNIFSKVSDKQNLIVLVTADKDDAMMYNKEVLNEIKPFIESGKVVLCYDKSESKIHAINRDMELVKDFSILINFSDDMEFVVDGFDDIIRSHFKTHFPNLDGNLHYNDGFTKDALCTMSVMGKTWYDMFGYIYHPDYKSLWCDNEYTTVAKKLNKMQYYDMILFKHNHPANVGGVVDEQLKNTESFADVDMQTFSKRQAINFGL